jgi:hypothetical protein
MLNEQNKMLLECENTDRTVVPGPLAKTLIRGRIDILNWFLAIRVQSDKENTLSSSGNARLLKMLQKQKKLLMEPINHRRPSPNSKIEVQGRIEMLEWLLLND